MINNRVKKRLSNFSDSLFFNHKECGFSPFPNNTPSPPALAKLEDWYEFDKFYPGYDSFNPNQRAWSKSLAKAKKEAF